MTHLTRITLVGSGVLFIAATAHAAPQNKVDVCHTAGGSGNVLTLSVNANALAGHLGHGDWLPEEFFSDADGDGYGDPTASVWTCEQPAGTSAVGTDCDDSDTAANPGASEICDDGRDNDCDGQIDEDCTETCEGAELVNYWSFDGDGLDLVGTNDFNVFGNTSYVSGVDGDALRINWQGGGAATPDLLSQFGDGPFTLAVWVNYHGDFAGHVRHEHIFYSTANGPWRELDLFAERNGTQTFFWTQGYATQWYTWAGASWITAQDDWHLVAMGRDADGVQYLCEDGVLTATDARYGNYTHSSAATFYLGRNPAENGGRSFPGAFDDMRVYDDWIGQEGCEALFVDNTCD